MREGGIAMREEVGEGGREGRRSRGREGRRREVMAQGGGKEGGSPGKGGAWAGYRAGYGRSVDRVQGRVWAERAPGTGPGMGGACAGYRAGYGRSVGRVLTEVRVAGVAHEDGQTLVRLVDHRRAVAVRRVAHHDALDPGGDDPAARRRAEAY